MGGLQFEEDDRITFPLVSVVIPCFNSSKFIQRTIQSALHQDYPNKEVIVINDGSTDGSLDLIKGFENVHIIDQDNHGVSHARNQGITKARGKYIAFLDSDDGFLKGNLLKKVQYLESHPEEVLVHATEKIVDERSEGSGLAKGKRGQVLNELLEFRETVIHSPSSVMVRKSVVEQSGQFDEALSTSADWEFWLRLANEGPFGFIDEPLSYYTVHEGQMHLNVDRMAMDMEYSINKAKKKGLIPPGKKFGSLRSNILFTIASSYIGDQGNYPKGIKFAFMSFFSSPALFFKRLLRLK